MLRRLLLIAMAAGIMIQGCATGGGGGADRGERCAQLAKDVDRLKGRPQQRNAAADRFDTECRN